MMTGYGWGGWGWLPMILFWVVLIGLAVWAIARLFPQITNPPPSAPGQGTRSNESAAEILKRRYAGGEISKAEYEEMRRTLEA